MAEDFQDGQDEDEGDEPLGELHSQEATSQEDLRRDAFARLFAKHDRWLFAYLVTLLSSPVDAEEVFQEISVVIWRNYEQFELGTDFVKWASVIAHNQVRKFRRQGRRHGFQLSDAALDLVAQETTRRADLLDFRRDALRYCIEQLSANDKQLVQMCYSEESTNFKSVAQQTGRPVNTVYKALNRIRRVLHECIDRKIAQEGLL